MTAQEEAVQHKPRMADLLSFLKKEIVGNELLFTADTARRVVEELGFRRASDAWNVLRRLEKKSQVTLKKKRFGKGIVVSFNAGEEPQAPKSERPARHRRSKGPNTLTVPQLLHQLETEIASLENTIAVRKEQLAEKKALFKQISTLARR